MSESPNGRCHDQTPDKPLGWPEPLEEAAFHGLAGEVVRAIEPHSEADPAALLIDFLVYFGNVVGRGPHATVEADRHGTNIFAVLVGETSKGRKGTSTGHFRQLFKEVDIDWLGRRVMGGMSSGEGLIWAIRDPIEKREPLKEKGRRTGEYQVVEVDPGVNDKRLLVYESEFASVLKTMARENNTLSTQVRQAWDSGVLRLLTKNSPAQATDAHISILGHITRQELLRYLTATDASNGFANRFLWICVRRSKTLPEGGGEIDYDSLARRIRAAARKAKELDDHPFERTTKARKKWSSVYGELSADRDGLYGAVTARAEAQVLRLSVIYATLDGSNVIKRAHLNAALAVWKYADQSARYIFGETTGNSVADRILDALHGKSLSRTDLHRLFSGHAKKKEINDALKVLEADGKIEAEDIDTGGRPAKIWSLA